MNEQQFSPDRKHNCYINFVGATQRMQERITTFEEIHRGQSGLGYVLDDIAQPHSAQEMVSRVAKGLGVIINPRDLSTGNPFHDPVKVMIETAKGAVIGLGLCKEQLRDTGISPKDLVPSDLKSQMHKPGDMNELHKLAERYLELSGHGLALMDPATQEIVESWIDEATPQIDRQIFTKTGLGIFLRNANFKLQECDAYKMRHEANAGGVDWDDLLGYCQENLES